MDSRPPPLLPNMNEQACGAITPSSPVALPQLLEERAVSWLKTDEHREPSAAQKTLCSTVFDSPSSVARSSSTLQTSGSRPSSFTPSLTGEGDEANLARFFAGLAAGENMDSLVHVLHRVMHVHYDKLLAAPQSRSTPTRGRRRRGAAPPFSTAITAAMVFGVESPLASVEATKLYFSPTTHALVCDESNSPASSPRSTRLVPSAPAPVALATSLCRYEAFSALPMRPRAMRHLLSDRAASALARDYWRQDRHLGQRRDWCRALAVLSQVQPTRETASTWVELHSRAGNWQMALQILQDYVPPAEWGQRELAACVRAMYRCALHQATVHERKATVGGSPRRHARKGADQLALETDAFVSYPVQLLETAARARERILVAAAAPTVSASTPTRAAALDVTDTHTAVVNLNEHALPSAVNDALGLLALRPDLWREACRLLDHFVVRPLQADTAQAGASEAAWAVQPNAVTVYQTCQALHTDWRLALSYASRILHAHPHISPMQDARTATSYLESCVEGARWQEALSFVGSDIQDESRSVTAALSPDLLLRVIRLFHAQQAARQMSQRLTEQLAHSRHYNTDTRSRALNALLQHSTTIEEAESHQARLQQCTGSAPEPSVSQRVVLENDSLVRLVHLYSRDGEWQKALHTLHTLLHDPQRQLSYLPTAQIHDEVQFAISQAAPPGPSWTLALGLFWTMCEGRGVPVSTVAFRAVAARCQAQGATSQHDQLMRFLVKRGVQRV